MINFQQLLNEKVGPAISEAVDAPESIPCTLDASAPQWILGDPEIIASYINNLLFETVSQCPDPPSGVAIHCVGRESARASFVLCLIVEGRETIESGHVWFQIPAAGEGNGSPVCPVDFDRLHTIADDDSEFEKELVELFVGSASQTLIQIDEACDKGNLQALRAAAHKLKGMSANIGAWKLTELATRMMAHCDGGRADVAAETRDEIHPEYNRVAACLAEFLER